MPASSVPGSDFGFVMKFAIRLYQYQITHRYYFSYNHCRKNIFAKTGFIGIIPIRFQRSVFSDRKAVFQTA